MSTPSEMLRELASFVAETKLDCEFFYGQWSDECGTLRCMGGWACAVWPDKLMLSHDGFHCYVYTVCDRRYGCVALATAIGISVELAEELFMPNVRSSVFIGERSPNRHASIAEVCEWFKRHADELEAK